MTAEVVLFPGVTRTDLSVHHQPRKEVIEYIELLLADAREGKIQALGVTFVDVEQRPFIAWRPKYVPSREDTYALVAGAGALHLSMLEELLAGGQPTGGEDSESCGTGHGEGNADDEPQPA